MALQTSGPISLNQIHIEAGGSSGTPCSLNDSDIRGLIGKGSGVAMSFSEWYGASSSLWSPTLTAGYFTTNFPSYVYTSGYSSYLFAGFGSLSDTTVDFYSGAFCLSIYTTWVGGGNYYLYFEVGGSQSNSGWTSITIPGFGTYNRASGTFYTNDEEGGVGWYWSVGTNVFSPGSTYAITFQ